MLLAYNWPADSERYRRVNGFVQAFFEHLKDIKARRPKWQDFDIAASVAGWTRFPAAEQWVKKAELSPEPDKINAQQQAPLDREARGALFQAFADYLRTPEPQKAAIRLEPQQREALFRDFAKYQKHQPVMLAYRYPGPEH